jgi:phosphoribosyl 1,2-cyclic phosphodiesterase
MVNGRLAILSNGDNSVAGESSLGMVFLVNGSGVLIECGPGTAAALAASGIDPLTIGDLFVSHRHWDHVGGFKDTVEYFVQTALVRGASHKLRLWGPDETVDELMSLAQKNPLMRVKRKKGIKPLTIWSGLEDRRFATFGVNHYGGPSCGLFCRLNGQRLIYFGDTGNTTDYAGILQSFPKPTAIVMEANNGLGPSTPKHMNYQGARAVFDLVDRPDDLDKILWHIRHDRDRVIKKAVVDGITIPATGDLIFLGG